MKRIFYAILLGFISLQVSAQNYTFTKSTGVSYPYSNINFPFSWDPTTTTTLLTSSDGNNLSNWYTLPFNFSFYGKTVTGFYASPNGYITFDRNQQSSNRNDDTLKNSDAPDNSIFAFWAPLAVKSADSLVIPANNQNYLYTYGGGVVTWTTGLPGNRICYVTWALISNANLNPSVNNNMNFCIRLYETGGFDIVYGEQMGNIGNNLTGVVGCKSWDNTTNTMITNSNNPFLPFLGRTASPINSFVESSQDVVESFFYGTQPSLDISVDAVVAPEEITLSGASVNAYINNRGSANGVNYAIYCSVNGATPTAQYSPTTLNSDAVTTFSGTTALKLGTGLTLGKNNIKVWISAPGNVNTDTILSTSTFVVSGTNDFPVNPVVEEYTGAWCGWCPNGAQGMDDLLKTHYDAIVVAVHDDLGAQYEDSMGLADGYTLATALKQGDPSASINRVPINTGSSTVFAVGFPNPSPTTLAGSEVIQVYNEVKYQSDGVTAALSPVHVNLTQSYNSSTRELTVTLRPKFSDSVMRYKLYYDVYLEENGVKANSNQGMDQHIYAHFGTETGPYLDPSSDYYMDPAAVADPTDPGNAYWLPNFTWNHVLRAMLGGLGVQPGVGNGANQLPAQFAFNQEYDYTFTTQIPSNWNDKNINIVGFVNYLDNNLSNSQEILGANQLPMTATQSGQTTQTDIKQVEKSVININNVYPNPSTGAFSADIEFTHPVSAYCYVTDIAGKTIMTLPEQTFGSGIQSLNFNLTSLTPGIYFLTIKSEEGSSTQKIMISR